MEAVAPERGRSNRIHVYRDFHPADFIVFNQIRRDANPQREAIKASIERRGGVINAVDAALTDRASVEAYRDFTEQTWGSPEPRVALRKIRFTPGWEDDERYLMLIAGHTRHEVVSEISRENVRRRLGYFALETKLYRVSSVDEIVALQRDENLHTTPTADRTMRSYAETFLWEKQTNPGLTKEEYMLRTGVSRYVLDRALAYAVLPKWVRETVTDEVMPFSVAYEIARFYQARLDQILLQETGMRHLDEVSDSELERLTDIMDVELGHAIGVYNVKCKRKALMATGLLSQETKAIRTKVDDILIAYGFKAPRPGQLFVVSHERFNREARRKEVIAELREFRTQSGESAFRLQERLLLHVGESGSDLPESAQAVSELIRVADNMRLVGLLEPIPFDELYEPSTLVSS